MARGLELKIHKLTDLFPKEEKYRSVDQLKRSSSAVSNNIAEAYNKQSIKNKTHILRDVAISEAEETESNILRCADKGFLPPEVANNIALGYIEFKKATNGYIRFLRRLTN